jgi:hypothetical protein
MSKISDVTVNYSPTDYFYVMANDVMPTDAQCNDPATDFVIISDASCVSFPSSGDIVKKVNECESELEKSSTDVTEQNIVECLKKIDNNDNKGTTTYAADYPKWKQWQDLSMNCYKKELCNNKKNAIEINRLQNNHLGSDQNYENTKAIYTNQYMKTVNLSIGVIFLLLAIYYSNK